MSIDAQLQLQRGEFRLDVTFSLPERGISAIFGASGCGKTSLLRVIAGLERAKGYLKIGERVWQDDKVFLSPQQRRIGYVFQEPSLFPHLDVAANLAYGFKRAPKAQRKISLAQAIELLDIENLLKRRVQQLSGGEQQRVAIARALASSPEMLLLDEPLAALDQGRKQEILPYLDSLPQSLDIPMLYVSHAREEVARLADYLVLLDAGKIQAQGQVSELFSRLDLPLAHEADTETVITAQVVGYDQEYALNWLDFSGGRFQVAGKPRPIGTKLRLQILARDVSLTLARQTDTSILNIFAAKINSLAQDSAAQITVRLQVGNDMLLARITKKSAQGLDLQQGKKVFVQIKTVALID